MSFLQNLLKIFKIKKTYLKILFRRIDDDQLQVVAGHLTYVSLLSVVPLVVVVFALFSAFPTFKEVSEQIKEFVFNNFVPAAGDTIKVYLEEFVKNSNKMTTVGICGLIVTALLLISSIDNALNRIWQVKEKRSMVYSFAVYWMVLTLGPILVGGSMGISSLLLSQKWLNSEFSRFFEQILRIFPLLLSFITYWLLYMLVPNVKVSMKYSAIGALFAAALFEFGKKLFSIYVVAFPSYQLIYGVMAVIPILFLWIYLSWCIILLGAEVAVSLQEYEDTAKS